MLPRLLFPFLQLLIAVIAQAQTETISIYFESADHRLEENEFRKLEKLVELEHTNVLSITIKAYADSDGDSEYNTKLSQSRAQAVLDYLNNFGIVVNNVDFYGEGAPLADNTTEQGKALNRCVQIIYTKEQLQQSLTNNSTKRYTSLEELLFEIRPEEEFHCINNRKDTILICKKGTAIEFKAYCFEDYDPFRCVEIRITEAHQRSDMLLSGMNTKSGPDWLVSGGMLAVNAYQDNRQLKMQLNKPASVFIPTDQPDERMKLFYSEPDDINWHLEEEGQVYSWDRRGFNSRFNRGSRPVKCRFFWCRIGRAFQSKTNRLPMVDGNILASVVNIDGLSEDELTQVFGEGTLKELNAKLNEANTQLSEMNYYAFKSAKLGYINCDYFMGSREELIVANTRSVNTILADVNMVFKKQNVVMNGMSPALGDHTFLNVPADAPVIVVGIGLENGQPVLAIQEVDVAESLQLHYEPSDAKSIQQKVRMYLD
jgi:hypothetical protein